MYGSESDGSHKNGIDDHQLPWSTRIASSRCRDMETTRIWNVLSGKGRVVAGLIP